MGKAEIERVDQANLCRPLSGASRWRLAEPRIRCARPVVVRGCEPSRRKYSVLIAWSVTVKTFAAMTMKIRRIIIVGGGIGGLAAGLALQRRGFKITVYERAVEFREFGAGLIVTANARRALRDLGVDARLEAASSCVPLRCTCDYATGEVLDEVSTDQIAQRYGIASLQVHRADLHGILLKAVRANDPAALRSGHAFVSLTQDASTVKVSFANGVSEEADAVIGSDGNASAVRSYLFPGEATHFNGQIAFRALIPDELVPPPFTDKGW